eukprot:CAMPEP_0181327820 /NCGR_PEP_ID=MMETSP1101-20121128/22330_1 /TAXON_ID=46948 /ORGANISM="Rhodomonas abbreviata, Strain Caron Lab Isolate" /LENGTH=186 /DNA_ID=CAMNT_0023436555 /DNA_START=16 /DNA_END=573 /DNA_ORIENTATION=-
MDGAVKRKRSPDSDGSSSDSSDSDSRSGKKRHKKSKDRKDRKSKKDKKLKKEKKEKKEKKKHRHKDKEQGTRVEQAAQPLFDFQQKKKEKLLAESLVADVGAAHAYNDHDSPPASSRQPEAQGEPSGKRRMVPMSKAEADKEDSKIEEVWDEDTGRMRLIRGGGEVIERIVSASQHKRINKQATNW